MEWYLKVLRNYAVFQGRAQRKEYWMFYLFNVLIVFVLALFDAMIGTADPTTGWGLFSGLYSLAVLVPAIAVSIRRLHDTGRSGWWLLVGFIPVIGFLVLLVFMVLDSEPGENQYGPNPKGAQETA